VRVFRLVMGRAVVRRAVARGMLRSAVPLWIVDAAFTIAPDSAHRLEGAAVHRGAEMLDHPLARRILERSVRRWPGG